MPEYLIEVLHYYCLLLQQVELTGLSITTLMRINICVSTIIGSQSGTSVTLTRRVLRYPIPCVDESIMFTAVLRTMKNNLDPQLGIT